MKPPRNAIVLVGNKLIGIDTFLPVVMKLSSELPSCRIFYLFITRDGWSVVQRNYVILEGMQKTGTLSELFPRFLPVFLARVGGGFTLLKWCLRALFARTWIFAYSDPGKLPVKQLGLFARIGGGRVITYLKLLYPMSPMLANQYKYTGQKPGTGAVYTAAPDQMICYFSAQSAEVKTACLAKFVTVGNPHTYRAWTCLLDDVIKRIGVIDHEGQSIEVSALGIVTVFYSGNVIIPSQLDEPEQSLRMILEAASSEVSNYLFLVKPHPNADLARMQRILSEFPSLRTHVTDAHPQILSRLSALVVFNNGSNAMNDAYLEHVPVAETSVYRPEFLEWGDSMRPNLGRLDGSSFEKIRGIFRQLREAPSTLVKPSSAELASPEPACLVDLLSPSATNPQGERRSRR